MNLPPMLEWLRLMLTREVEQWLFLFWVAGIVVIAFIAGVVAWRQWRKR